MARVLVTGGTGLVGMHLCNRLLATGYEVSVLGRQRIQKKNITSYTWDWTTQQIEQEAIHSADYIVHLAGANIASKKWTAARRQEIIESRIKTGQMIFNIVGTQPKKLKAFISASAIGYYGTITSDKIFKETDTPASDFLGSTCKQWEDQADLFEELGTRSVKIRTGVVLTKQGGALSKMTAPIKLGVGAALGSGKQYLPWIHIGDLCNIYIKAIEDDQLRGAYNAVAPQHVTNKEFMRTLAHVLKKPFLFPNVPGFILKPIFGKMSEVLLEGSRISSDKVVSTGFLFEFPTLEGTLSDLLAGKKHMVQRSD